MANKYYKVYKVSQSLGRGIKKAKTHTEGYGSAFVKGVKRGYSGPKQPSSQTHLQKHWKKYAHGGGHAVLAGHAYSKGRQHGNPYKHRDDPKALDKAFKKMNKDINKHINKRIREKERR